MVLNQAFVLQSYNHLFEHRSEDFVVLFRTGTLIGTGGSQTIDVDLTGIVRDDAPYYYLPLIKDTVGANGDATVAFNATISQSRIDATSDDDEIGVLIFVRHEDIKPANMD